ncbi:DUF829 domain-containing protein [Campylobacter cuniculorum]|uniref:DUF829 domain-containing protein n=1 Tax=Campylobacter cuniculorum TaxID=374106 RepID=UPI0023F51C16|nr:DUF829 domain-containing protein [Campylobacter cuniculorum]
MLERDVFYIAGYDPRSYRHYYALFKKELNLYDNSLKINISKSNTNKKFPFWEILTPRVKTCYTFLAWNDLVRKNWTQNIQNSFKDAFNLFRIYIITGLFIKFGKESIYQLITGFYPFFYVLFSLLFSFVLGFFVFIVVKIYVFWFFALILGILALVLINQILFKFGKKLAVFWITRICVFCAKWHRIKQGAFDKRLEEFAQSIFNALKAHQNVKNYELILLSHSVGTILCIEVLARVLFLCKENNLDFSQFKILTLGECIPLVSYQKKSLEFRKKLEFISKFDLKWYDYTSIIDGACFPQVDFFTTSGIKEGFRPKFYSPKFHTLYEKEHYKKIKKDKYKAHFLYLMSSEIKGQYDFFDFVVGEKILEEKIN